MILYSQTLLITTLEYLTHIVEANRLEALDDLPRKPSARNRRESENDPVPPDAELVRSWPYLSTYTMPPHF